ncbi:MAG: DMT family transporter [FCB group bacterium]|nr:DMT family transporter [FCB group bacterium]
MEYFGEIAALTAALCWAFTSVFFTQAGKLIGSFQVNKIRLVIAVTIYSLILLTTQGHLFSENITFAHFFWLGLSGFVGLVIGDTAGFKAMVMIGPRLTTLLYSLSPIIATFIAWIFLGEKLHFFDMIGITVTLMGISWVVSERKQKTAHNQLDKNHPDAGSLAKGVGLGIIAASGQATGLVLAKYAMLDVGASIQPLEASFIRMLVAMVFIWLFSVRNNQFVKTIAHFKNRKAISYILGGAFFGPFLGVWLSLVAIKHIAAGIATTLNATTPIMVIPVVRYYYKEKISFRAVVGAVVTIVGITILLLY